MNFEIVFDALVNKVLGPAERGRFRTIGYQDQKRAAIEVLDCNRTVQIFYDNGNFSRSGGRRTGPAQHDCVFAIDLTVSRAVQADLATINSGTTPQKINAMLAMESASFLAERSINDLIAIIWNILRDGNNIDLGCDSGLVANVWVEKVIKKRVSDKGEYVIVGAEMDLSLRVSEQPSGAEGIPIAADGFDSTINVDPDNDNFGKSGVTV